MMPAAYPVVKLEAVTQGERNVVEKHLEEETKGPAACWWSHFIDMRI